MFRRAWMVDGDVQPQPRVAEVDFRDFVTKVGVFLTEEA